MKKYLLGIVLFGCLLFSGAIAQSNFESEPNITISTNPTDPREGERVTVLLTSYETNLDLAYIKWAYGQETLSGYGEKQFIIISKNTPGAENSVVAEITLANGMQITKNISFSSLSYDLAWETINSKNIPFYMGKKIPVRENDLRVVVLNPSSSQTAYVWTRNGKAIQNKSSNTRNYIDFKNTEIERSENIAVSVVKPNTDTKTASVNIPFATNKILFYEYNPLTGLSLGKTIKNATTGYDNTVSVFAVPFGINKIPNPEVSWNLSGEDVNTQKIQELISFIKPDDNGIVRLNLDYKNPRSLYQGFKSGLELNF